MNDNQKPILTVIFTVPADAQTARLNRGKAQSNRLAQCSGVDVRDPILITHTPVGEVQPLAGDISVWIRSIIRV